MRLSKENQLYDKQWDIVDTFYNTQEPEGFGSVVTSDEVAALETYYLVNPQGNDVYEYRKQLADTNPNLVKMAEGAARKIAIADGFSDDEVEGMFSVRQ